MPKNKKQHVFRILFILSVPFILCFLIFDFGENMETLLTQQEYDRLSEISHYENSTLRLELNSHLQLLELISTNTMEYATLPREELVNLLKVIASAGSFDRVGIADTTGNALLNDGTTYNISRRPYFLTALSGEPAIVAPITSYLTHRPSVFFALPAYAKGQLIGVVYGAYSLEAASAAMLRPASESDRCTMVFNSEGDLLMRNDGAFSETEQINFFNWLSALEIDPPLCADQVESALTLEREVTFRFIRDGIAYYAVLAPLQISDWFSCQIVPQAAMAQQQSALSHLSYTLLAKGVGISLFLLLISVYLWGANQRKARENLEQQRRQYQDMLSRLGGGVMLTQRSKNACVFRTVYINETFQEMTGYNLVDLQTGCASNFSRLVHPDHDPNFLQNIHGGISQPDTYQHSYRLRRKDGSYIWVMESGSLHLCENGCVLNQILLSDISYLKEQEEKLTLSAESLRISFSLTDGAAFEFDLSSRTYLLAENLSHVFGPQRQLQMEQWACLCAPQAELPCSEQLALYYHPEDTDAVLAGYRALFATGRTVFEARIHRETDFLWCRFHLFLIYNQQHQAQRVIGNVVDISDTKSRIEDLQNAADHDPLTGLYNRTAFRRKAEEALTRPSQSHAFFLLDLDNFKKVNDRLGHVFGDAALVETARRLRSALPSTCLAARLGGDEFAVFVSSDSTLQPPEILAQNICSTAGTFTLDSECCELLFSLGIARNGAVGNASYDSLYRLADKALYHTKREHKGKWCCLDL